MTKKRLVVALGREAFGAIIPEQKKAVKRAAKAIADLVEAKYQIIITHSNGPQVGMLHTAMTEFSRLDNAYTVAPMSVCGALSQGYIGYDLQNAIRSELLERGIYKPVSTIITQVRVDPFDEAFHHPTKVIGRYMTKDEAAIEEEKGNYVMKEEKGFRRVVATPKPIDIYEIDAIKALSDANQLVIACGGGGIPVLEQGTHLRGASAVIEKDTASAKLADMLDADEILFLTGVEKVCLNYHTPEETTLNTITVEEAKNYVREGHFPETSMLPKIEASIEFVSKKPGRKAVITHLDKAKDAMLEKTGTIIVNS
ncbi:carbamate kinase [Lachnotalea glycerini]|uniref:Carbamate kinase n=1 Tax=Lachnotalea glycerini TaxID=1763509 RepID=A0A255INA5_9FIRM|nr:carbamate kinase [Lachnotalea glycerini]PXV86244.1 carbamate kinase [Lachnotalea glycerini]RDY31581.1 carbamate kinase [Lachnotalea glycerini]